MPYLALELRDRSGAIQARAFRDADLLAGRFERGDLVRVRGRVDRFRDELQLEVREIARAEAADPAAFLPVAYRDLDELDGFLEHLAREVHDPGYAARAGAPAGRRRAARGLAPRAVHGAAATTPTSAGCSSTRSRWRRWRSRCAQLHVKLNSDLLICAALVHDLGKTREFTYGAAIEQSEEGRLLGHLVLGQQLLEPVPGRPRGRAPARAPALRTHPPRAEPTGASARARRSRSIASTRSTRASRARSSTASHSATGRLRVMRTLILGGTVFLGRHVAAEALVPRPRADALHARVARRRPVPEARAPASATAAATLSALHGREWDVVVDTSGYRADDVAASSALLGDRAPRVRLQPQRVSGVAGGGGRRGLAACGRRATTTGSRRRPASGRPRRRCPAAWPPSAPGFSAARTTTSSGSRGGCGASRPAVACPRPGDPGQPIQLIDARDLAAGCSTSASGASRARSTARRPPAATRSARCSHAAVSATGGDAELAWIPDERLQAAGVEPWTELPLWLPAAVGTWTVGTERAQASGLRCRPIAETVADVWTWLRDGGEAELRRMAVRAQTSADVRRPRSGASGYLTLHW